MKKLLVIITVLLLSFELHAQRSKISFWTLDASYGISIPFGASEIPYSSDEGSFVSFSNINFGVRYNYNKDWGVGGHVTSVNYRGDNGLGTDNFRLDVQAYYNLGRFLGFHSASNYKFGLLVHSGFGVTWSTSLYIDEQEHMGNYIIGFSPLYKVSKKFAILSDISYTANIKQHFHFDGIPYPPDKFKTGNLFGVTLGVIYYLVN